jgi:hypothetical protein
MQQTVRVRSAALVLGCLLALGVAGCGGEDKPEASGPTAPPSALPASVGTVQGRLLMVGGPAPGAPDPVPGRLTIKGTGSTLHADIGKDGTYAIQLAPGRYRITATSPSIDDGAMTCTTAPATTTLTAGRTVTADVVCSVP